MTDEYACVRVWTHERKYEPRSVGKHPGYVVLVFDDHKRTFPWSQIQEIQEVYDAE